MRLNKDNNKVNLSYLAICLFGVLFVTLITSVGFYGWDILSEAQAQKALLLNVLNVSITALLCLSFTLWLYNRFMQRLIEDQIEYDKVLEEYQDTERSLHNSNEVLLALIQASPLAIVTLDSSGNIETWNRAAERMFGWTSSEVLERGNPVVPTERKEEFNELLERVLYGDTKLGIELICAKKDGSELDVSLSIAPLRDESGAFTKAVALLKDITKRKKAESLLRKAKEEAENEARNHSNFLSYMSHELKTPITGIIGLSQLLSSTDIDDEQKGYINMIRTGGKSLMSISNDILDFSKIKSGKLELESKPFSIKKCIDEVFDIVMVNARDKKLDLVYSIDELVPTYIRGDAGRIKQVLVNLISNAIKFTVKGKIFLSVEKKYQNAEKVELLFAVTDTGIGLSKEQIPLLFKTFSQTDASVARKYGGSGLGLFICKQISELMGGRIWVESKVGRGSTFSFTVRCNLSSSDEYERRLEDTDKIYFDHASSHQHEPNSKIKILLAEDDADSLRVQKEMFEEMGYNADVVPNGDAVLSALENEDYSFIFMDIDMPRFDDGIEAAKRIKASGDAGRLKSYPKIIAVSNSVEEHRARYIDAGLDDCVKKPFSKDEILTTLKKWDPKSS